jgi:hypothetical protein
VAVPTADTLLVATMQLVLCIAPMSVWVLSVGGRVAHSRARFAKWGSLFLIVVLNANVLWMKLYMLSGWVSIVASPGVVWAIPVFVWCSRPPPRQGDKILRKDK